jgi:hypothetical protein
MHRRGATDVDMTAPAVAPRAAWQVLFKVYATLLILGCATLAIVLSLGFGAEAVARWVGPARFGVTLAALAVLLAAVPLLGALALRERTRVRPAASAQARPAAQPGERVSIDLDSLWHEWNRRHALAQIAAWAVPCGLVLVVVAILLARAGAAELVGIGKLAALLLGVAVPIAWIAARVTLAPMRDAIALTRGTALRFELDASGLKAPLLLLTEPAFHKLLARRQTHAEVRWEDIVRWQVYPAVGRSRPQHLLWLRAGSSDLGTGSLGLAQAPVRFGLLRRPLLAHEQSVLAHVRRRLGERLEVRDEVVPASAP